MTLHSEKRDGIVPDATLSSTRLPTVWVLVDDRPGNTTQSIGLHDRAYLSTTTPTHVPHRKDVRINDGSSSLIAHQLRRHES